MRRPWGLECTPEPSRRWRKGAGRPRPLLEVQGATRPGDGQGQGSTTGATGTRGARQADRVWTAKRPKVRAEAGVVTRGGGLGEEVKAACGGVGLGRLRRPPGALPQEVWKGLGTESHAKICIQEVWVGEGGHSGPAAGPFADRSVVPGFWSGDSGGNFYPGHTAASISISSNLSIFSSDRALLPLPRRKWKPPGGDFHRCLAQLPPDAAGRSLPSLLSLGGEHRPFARPLLPGLSLGHHPDEQGLDSTRL